MLELDATVRDSNGTTRRVLAPHPRLYDDFFLQESPRILTEEFLLYPCSRSSWDKSHRDLVST
jgi:hypothetical protein